MSTPLTTIQVPFDVAQIIQGLQQKAQEQGIELAQLLQSVALDGQIPPQAEATPAEKAKAWREWALSHAHSTPVILDDRREVLYEDDE